MATPTPINLRPTILNTTLDTVGEVQGIQVPANVVEWSFRVRSGVVRFNTDLANVQDDPIVGDYSMLGPKEGVSSPGQKNDGDAFRPGVLSPSELNTDDPATPGSPEARAQAGFGKFPDVATILFFDLDATSGGDAIVEIMWA